MIWIVFFSFLNIDYWILFFLSPIISWFVFYLLANFVVIPPFPFHSCCARQHNVRHCVSCHEGLVLHDDYEVEWIVLYDTMLGNYYMRSFGFDRNQFYVWWMCNYKQKPSTIKIQETRTQWRVFMYVYNCTSYVPILSIF